MWSANIAGDRIFGCYVQNPVFLHGSVFPLRAMYIRHESNSPAGGPVPSFLLINGCCPRTISVISSYISRWKVTVDS